MISTERISESVSLLLNSCGIDRIGASRRGSLRPSGRMDYHILYIAEGECRVVLGGREYAAGAGSLILYRPGERQEYYFEGGSGSVSCFIHFTGRDAEAILRSLGLFGRNIFEVPKSEALLAVFEQMHREFSLAQAAHEQVEAGLLLAFLGLCARGARIADLDIDGKRTAQVQRAIEKMYADMNKKLSVADLARECNFSLGYFSHLFRAVTGLSPHAYMLRLRIERAKNMLENTDLSVLEIALVVGFSDQNYFSRFFKEQTGEAPSAFRSRTNAATSRKKR